MSQHLLKDPIVVTGPIKTGVGTGTLTVDRLTHFTTAQTYTATCIATSPDIIFSIVGSLDGPVGIATQGIQFFDEDLKIFLTIQAGATAFEVGDQFTLTVENGSDLHQDNIDLYDELPQKNFGPGVKGLLKGDHNLRFSDTSIAAYLYAQDLKYKAVVAGPNGNNLQLQYLEQVPGTAAERIIQDLTYTAVDANAAGNGISIEYENYTPAVKAKRDIQNLRYKAFSGGAAGNNISIQYVNDVTVGSEFVGVIGNAITVHIQSGATTANAIKAVVEASAAAMLLLESPLTVLGLGTNPQVTQAQTFLTGGIDAIGAAGSEIVSVIGMAIKVILEDSVSTATQVKAAVDAFPAAAALVNVTISGTGSNFQTAPVTPPQFLLGGLDGIGETAPEVDVVGSLIKVYFKSGVATASQIKSAVDAFPAAAALATVEVVGLGANVQKSPVAVANFTGGLTKFYALNTKELTDVPNFHEGNASLKVRDFRAQGAAIFDKEAEVKGALKLEATDEFSGTAVPNVQGYLNELIARGKITVHCVGNAKLRYASGSIILDNHMRITFRDTGFYNQLNAQTIAIADGQSLYVELNSKQSGKVLSPLVGTTIPALLSTFRLATRIGDKLIWFNGVVQNDNDIVRAGGVVDYKAQIYGIIAEGGIVSSSDTTIGLVNWDSDLKLRQVGSTGIVTIPAGNVELADGEVAYIELDDPWATGTKVMQQAAIGTFDLGRSDRYWVFYRNGNQIFVRNGGTLVPGEERTIGEPVGADTFTYIGSSGETDATPEYTTANGGSTANSFVADNDNLTKAIKKLDDRAGIEQGHVNQDRNVELVHGTDPEATLFWDKNAGELWVYPDLYVQVPGVQLERNTIDDANPIELPNDGDVAWVTLNRSAGANAFLTVTVENITTYTPGDNKFIVARREGDVVMVGGTTRVVHNEDRALGSNMSFEQKLLMFGNGFPLVGDSSTADAQWAARGSSLRTIGGQSGRGILDAIALTDRELDRFFSQYRLVPDTVLEASFQPAVYVKSNLHEMSNESGSVTEAQGAISDTGKLGEFPGAHINFSTGVVTTNPGGGPLGDNFTPVSLTGNDYVWYGISVVNLATDAQNRQTYKIKVFGGTPNAVLANAVFPSITTGKAIGYVAIRNADGSPVIRIINLQVGAGSGGSGGGNLAPVTLYDNLRTTQPSSTVGLTGTISQSNTDGQFHISGGFASAAMDSIGQKFTQAVAAKLQSVQVDFFNNLGAHGHGVMTLDIVKDDGTGKPSNNPIDIVASSTNGTPPSSYSGGLFTFTFAAPTIPVGTHHFVLRTQAFNTTNFGSFALKTATVPSFFGVAGINQQITAPAGAWTAVAPTQSMWYVATYVDSLMADGEFVVDGDTILQTALTNPALNKRVYKVGISGTALTWTLEALGQDETGAPAGGDAVIFKLGKAFGNIIYNYDSYQALWVDYAASRSANRNLSNLNTPTAINQNLLPSASLLRSIGSDALRWLEGFFSTLWVNTIQGYGNPGGGSTSNLVIQTSGSGGSSSGSINVTTGVANGGQPSGSINLTIGTSNGVRGSVHVDARTLRQGSPSRFVEKQYFDGLTLTGATTAVQSSLTFDARTIKSVIISYTIVEATTNRRRTGRMEIACDGASGIAPTNVSMIDGFTETADVGVLWTKAINGNNVELSYTTTANNKTMHCEVVRLLA